MDELAEFNRQRWNELVAAKVQYGQPWLDLDVAGARRWLQAHYVTADLTGKDVLCLANGGGQQSVALALLGANVTVIDMSDAQLEQDRIAAQHHGLAIRLEQGDMRDLSRFADDSFDLVWHAFSINFVPDAKPVLQEVGRVIRPDGLYFFQFANPFWHGMSELDWNGEGYLLKRPYADAEIILDDPHWDVGEQRVVGPREFNHTLGPLLNSLVKLGFVIRGLWEDNEGSEGDLQATPGSWHHFSAALPPFFVLLATYEPQSLAKSSWLIG